MQSLKPSLASIHALLTEGRVDSARAACLELLSEWPRNVKLLSALSQIETRSGDDAAACRHARAAVALESRNPQVLLQLALALRGLDRREEEAAVYERILQLDHGHAPSHLGLGLIAQARGDDENAIRHFTTAHELLRAEADGGAKARHVHLQLASALTGLRRFEEATAIHQGMLQLDGGDAQPHIGLGYIARAQDDIATSIAHFEAAVTINASDFTSRLALANILVGANRLDDARAIYRRVTQQAPNTFRVRSNLGQLARTLGDLASALNEFQSALESDPGNTSVRINIAGTYADMGRWTEAEELYRGILDDLPQNVEALKGLAYAARARSDGPTALALFEDVEALAPFDISTKKEIRRLRAARKSFDWRTEINDAVATARSDQAPYRERIDAAGILVQYGLTEVAGPVLAKLESRFSDARKLLLAVQQMDRMGLAQPLAAGATASSVADQQLESLQGFVEKPVPGSDTLLVVFGQLDHRLWVTFSLLHRILRKSGASVVYARDLQQSWYTGGIVGLGSDLESTADGIRSIANRYGAKRIVTLGTCVGCAGALRFGLALGAEGVLGLHPRVGPDDLLTNRAGAHAIRSRGSARHGGVLSAYREAARRPKVTLIFGEHCARDAADARDLARVTDVCAIPIPGSFEMNTVRELLVLGLLEPVLLDFVATSSVSDSTRTLIEKAPRH
jgi:tetratricopeptide (TPR) repeat protein